MAKKDESTEKKTVVTCNIDEATFMRFAMFDTYKLRKYWRVPCVSGLATIAGAVFLICKRDQNPYFLFWGVLFVIIGLLVPLFALLQFKRNVRKQLKKHKPSRNTAQYFVVLSDSGLELCEKSKREEIAWDFVDKAYLNKDCIYVYLKNGKPYLLPQYNEPDDSWEIIKRNLGDSAVVLKSK